MSSKRQQQWFIGVLARSDGVELMINNKPLTRHKAEEKFYALVHRRCCEGVMYELPTGGHLVSFEGFRTQAAQQKMLKETEAELLALMMNDVAA